MCLWTTLLLLSRSSLPCSIRIRCRAFDRVSSIAYCCCQERACGLARDHRCHWAALQHGHGGEAAM
jgi:hypothetical protein